MATSSNCNSAFTRKSGIWTTPCLLAVIALQWLLFTILLHRNHQSLTNQFQQVVQGSDATLREHQIQAQRAAKQAQPNALVGVGATVIFRAPKWFHLRYLIMLQNAWVNLPRHDGSWKIQIFVNQKWTNDSLTPWHPGLERILAGDDTRFITSHLPNFLIHGKPKQVLLSSWFWENVAAEQVILFSGNGAFCGNQPWQGAWEELLTLDYCGVPGGVVGGDATSHSLRRRSAMRFVLRYADEHQITLQDERQIVDIMLRINQQQTEHNTTFHIATPEQTIKFGGVNNLSTSDGLVRLPLVVAGTQPRLLWEERDSLLKHCPELKMIFPSLHEPSCFGAHPDGTKCKATICALQDNRPGHGC